MVDITGLVSYLKFNCKSSQVKKLKPFSCEAFRLLAVAEMVTEVVSFQETSPALEKSWLLAQLTPIVG